MTTIEIRDNETLIDGVTYVGTPKKCGAAFAEKCTRIVPETIVPVIEVWISGTLVWRGWMRETMRDGVRFAGFSLKCFADFWGEVCPRGPRESALAFQDGFNWWLLNYVKWLENDYAKKHNALTEPETFGESFQRRW